MAQRQTTSIPVTPDTLELARACKRGGETWDDLVRTMVDVYQPEPNGGERD